MKSTDIVEANSLAAELCGKVKCVSERIYRKAACVAALAERCYWRGAAPGRVLNRWMRKIWKRR